MERPQLAAMLRKLSKHLRPDLAKVVATLAEASAASDDYAAVASTLFANFRTKKQHQAVQQTAELFSILAGLGEDGLDFAGLASAISKPPPPPPTKRTQSSGPTNRKPMRTIPPRVSKANEIASGIADRFAADLVEAQRDRDRFPKLHQQLKDNKRVNTATLHHIAHVFLGNSKAYSGRKQALDDILRRHHDALRIAEQDRMLDRLN